MNATTGTAARNKDIVRMFYDGGVRGDIGGFARYLHPDFLCTAPDYLPWGGPRRGADHYLGVTLPQVAKVLDFGRFSYDSLIAEDERVVALINVGVAGTDAMLMISEHWILEKDTALSIWVAYFEPKALLERIAANAGAGGA
ncbi:nuclear transport factor 2 family protein [Cupriavidus sp. 30B13]|uniref:nuclear transport factor 2 family protein n=1 Tax=Cupriavidus sp. 30B13 TaxID=3384241 RepID=UPI003B8F84D7